MNWMLDHITIRKVFYLILFVFLFLASPSQLFSNFPFIHPVFHTNRLMPPPSLILNLNNPLSNQQVLLQLKLLLSFNSTKIINH